MPHHAFPTRPRQAGRAHALCAADRLRSPRLALLCALFLSALLCLCQAPALAAEITITTNSDSGAGSLRDAVAAASSGDTLSFGAGLSRSTINLNSLLTFANTFSLINNSATDGVTVSFTDMGFYQTGGTLSLSGTRSLTIQSVGFDGSNYAIRGSGVLNLGSIGSNVVADSRWCDNVYGNSIAYGLYGSLGVNISGGLSGTVAASASGPLDGPGWAKAFGIYGDNLSLSGGLSGNVHAASHTVTGYAYGLYATGAMNGGDANTPLIISGRVWAIAPFSGEALHSGGAMNLLLTGYLHGQSASLDGAYAIQAGAGSTVTFNPGAGWGLEGKVELGGAGSSLTLLGTGTAANQFLNVPSLIVGNGATATNWTLNPLIAQASTFGSLSLTPNAALSLNENVSISGNIVNNGGLTYALGANKTYAGVISGTGSLTKAGAGVLTLSGANTYTGATLVNAGTLQAGAANIFGASSGFTLANTAGATLNLNNFSQTIAGLSGGGAAGGNVALGSALLTVNNAGSNSYAGVISGTGGLTKTGAGTQTLSGANTYTGATLVNAGTLSLSGSLSSASVTVASGAALANAGTLTNSGTLNNAGTLSNSGTLNNTGTLANAGTLTNSGTWNNAGGTFTNSGTLNNTAAMSGGTLNNSGTLNNAAGGSMNLTALNVLSGSTVNLAPGTAITTTNAALSSAATYRFLGSTAGTATITSGADFTGDGATGFTQTYSTIMTTSVFTVPAAGRIATLSYTAKDLGSIGGSSGAALDAVRRGAAPGSPLANLFNALYGSNSPQQIQGATQQLVGEGVANGFGGIAGQLGAFQGAIGQQQMGLSSGSGPQNLALGAAGGLWSTTGNRRAQGNGLAQGSNGIMETAAEILIMNTHGTDGPGRLYGSDGVLNGRGQAQTIHQGSRGGLSGYSAELGLAALGYDTRVNDYAHLGVALGYSAGQVHGAGVKTDLSTWMASLYGTADFGALNLDANLTYARTTGKMKGSYTFPEADNTSGEYVSNTYFGALKASRAFRFEDAGFTLTPSVAIEASMSMRDAFTESGSALSKRFAGSTMNTVAVPVGVAVSKDFALDKGTVSPELSAYYVRQLADTQSTGTMTLLNSSTPSQVTGADPGKELWRANLGWRYDSSENLRFSLFYNGEFGNKYSSNGATLEVKYAF